MYIKISVITYLFLINLLGQSLNNLSERLGSIKNLVDSNALLLEQIIQWWNGIEWENGSKTIIKYNQMKLKENERDYSWIENEWFENGRITYFYNSSHQLIKIIIEDIFISWDTTRIINFKYDKEGRECERIVKSWDQDRGIYVQWKTISSYQEENLTEEINQYYENEVWVNFNKWIYKFDLNRNITERKQQRWMNNDWENYERSIFLFNEHGEPMKICHLYWSNAYWDTLAMQSFIYNELLQLIEKNNNVKQGGVWINDSKSSYDYNIDGKLVLQLFQYWADSVLLNSLMVFYEYNENGKISQEIEQNWRDSIWENSHRVHYDYDLKDNMIEKIHSNWSEGKWLSGVKYIYKYDLFTDIVEKNLGINSLQLENNYPNPFNPTTSIKYAVSSTQFVTLKIYDILGNEVATLVNEEKPIGVYEVEFDAKNLSSGVSARGGYASGVYFYQLRAGSFVETKKMILLR